MRTAAIIQARYGSSRLPGKVLLPLGGGCVLDEVVRRCQAVPGVTLTCVAVPDSAESDNVAARAAAAGATVVRGPEHDVLARYAAAARHVDADVVLRVTSDCPLLDPTVAGQVLAARAAESADYAANNRPPRAWPHGLDCEAMTRKALERALTSATTPYEREHVTPWLRNADGIQRSWIIGPGDEAPAWRWTLDFPEDYAFLSATFDRLPSGIIPPWTAVAALIEGDPMLCRLHRLALEKAESPK
jgi:spore coat polysaccharide biosynthesis protein SpsF